MLVEAALISTVTVLALSPIVMVFGVRRPANGEKQQLANLKNKTRLLTERVNKSCKDCTIAYEKTTPRVSGGGG